MATATPIDLSKLEVVHIDSIETLKKNQSIFDETYDLYRRCFPLLSEQQAKESFEAIMEANFKSKGCKESWVILRDPAQNGKAVAAMNFDSMLHIGSKEHRAGIHNIFTMVDESSREAGLFGRLEEEAAKITASMVRVKTGLKGPMKILMGAEQNSPFLMTGKDVHKDSIYNATTKTAEGIEQFIRRYIFGQSKYALLDARYVQQPILTAEGTMEANETLDYVLKQFEVADDGKVIHLDPPKDVSGKTVASMIRQFFKGPSFVNEETGELRNKLEPEIEALLKKMESQERITLRTPDYKALHKLVNTEVIAGLSEADQEKRLGELPQFRKAMEEYFGKGRLSEYGFSAENVAETAKKGISLRTAAAYIAGIAVAGGGIWLLSNNGKKDERSHADRVRDSQKAPEIDAEAAVATR